MSDCGGRGEVEAPTGPGQGLLLSAISELDSLSENNIVNENEPMKSRGSSSTQSPEPSMVALESPVKSMMPAPGTPLTPTANLKVLVAAASSALDRELAECTAKKEIFKDSGDYDSVLSTGRKMKSLALLCKRFLEVAEQDIGTGNEFSLEMMASKLGINRRRIYDIINVMEALEMISKQSKNWYRWLGRGELVYTLAKLKAMAGDDPDVRPFFEAEQADDEDNKENQQPFAHRPARKKQNCDDSGVQCDSQADPENAQPVTEEENDSVFMDSVSSAQPPDMFTRSVRYDKSLGVLCQKFVMLFLVSPMNEVTLEEAGKYLVPDSQEDQFYVSVSHSANPKTKVRRLYDIANILTSLGIIKKKVFVGPYNYKKPGYVWSGPSMREVDEACKQKGVKCGLESSGRKSRTVRTPTHAAVVRKHALNSRPPLQQQEQHCPESDSEAHGPFNDGSACFKRSLSFGEQNKLQPRVLARPLCSKQVDYLREMKEFEAEVQKHAHRYPNVANIFRDFIQKYQSTLEHAAANYGRFILPKTPSPNSLPQKAQPSGVAPPVADGPLQQPLVFEHDGDEEEQSQTEVGEASPVPGGSSSMAVALQPTMTSTPTSNADGIKKESSEEALVGGEVHASEVPPHLLGKPLPPPKFPVASIPVFQGVEPVDTASQTATTTTQAPISSPTAGSNVLSSSDAHPQEVAYSVDVSTPSSSAALSNATNLVANLTTSILASVLSSLPNAAFFEPVPVASSSLGHIPLVAATPHSQGTLVSPIKTHTNSFVRVEDFLTPSCSKPGIVISQPIIVSGQPSQQCIQVPAASVPCLLDGHLPLQANSNSNNAVGVPSLGALVNQKPIPAVYEIGPHSRLVHCTNNGQSFTGLSTFNPNSFLTGAGQQPTVGGPLGDFFENSAQAKSVLPMNHANPAMSDGSPSKRPRLD